MCECVCVCVCVFGEVIGCDRKGKYIHVAENLPTIGTREVSFIHSSSAVREVRVEGGGECEV